MPSNCSNIALYVFAVRQYTRNDVVIEERDLIIKSSLSRRKSMLFAYAALTHPNTSFVLTLSRCVFTNIKPLSSVANPHSLIQACAAPYTCVVEVHLNSLISGASESRYSLYTNNHAPVYTRCTRRRATKCHHRT